MIDIGSRIKEIRKSKKMTQIDLANKSGVSRNYISEIETGERTNPSILHLLNIAKGLEVPLLRLGKDFILIQPKKFKFKFKKPKE